MNITDFDDIRPYNPEEFLEAMQRIAHSSSFPILSAYVYPEESVKGNPSTHSQLPDG